MARIFAAALNCAEPADGDACAECSSCRDIQNGNSITFEEIDAASHGQVDHVREIQERVSYDVGADWRVVALDEAHSMSRAAFNALLKLMEEPPERTTFILLTTEVAKIPETVVSRTMVFDFRRVTLEDITARLRFIAKEIELPVTPEVVTEIAVRAQGGLRDAVMMLDQCSRMDPPVVAVEQFRELFGIYDIAVPLFDAALRQDHAKGARLIEDYFHRVGDAQGMVADLVALVRDLIVLKSGGTPPVPTEAAMRVRNELAAKVNIGLLIGVTKVLWELKSRTRAVDNDHRASMEMAFVLIVSALHPAVEVAPILGSPPVAPGSEPLSNEEMARIAATYQGG